MSVDLSYLIELVKIRPEIYHRNYLSEEFNNTLKAKEAAWEEISKKLGDDVNFLKKKWRTLRDQFQRNYKRIQSSGDGEKIEIHWPYFEQLLFLKDHCKSKDSINSSKIGNEDDSQISTFFCETEAGYINEDDSKYNLIETKFETITEDCINQLSEDRDCDDYYLVTTSAEQNDDILNDNKLHKNCDSNTMDDRLQSSTSKQKRKSFGSNSNNLQISIKRAKYLNESDENDLDRQISECLDNIKKKTETPLDHIDHFCNFIGSMLKQWPQKRQCEAMNYFTNYVMENHSIYREEK